METHQEILQSKLSEYLNSTSLSLTQVASKLEISKSHLSEIKNGKKNPQLDLGLKILKHCGLDLHDRKAWVEAKYLEESSEYEELKNSIDQTETKHKLSHDISEKLALDLTLMNIFLDIVEAKENGITKDYLKKFYGLEGLAKLDVLINANMVKHHCGSYFAGDQRVVMTKDASYHLLKTLTDDQHKKFQQGILDGKFQFQITDVSEHGKKLLEEKFEEYMQATSEILKEHKLSTHHGGKRIFTQSMIGLIKNSFQVLVLSFFIFSYSYAGEGGVEGGSSSLVFNGFETELQALEHGFQIEEEFNHKTQRSKLEKKTLYKYCTGFVALNAFADIKAKNVKVEPYWKNTEKFYEVKVNIKVDCIGNPLRN